jgi:hypothetical protein
MAGDYTKAFYADIKRLTDELKKLQTTVKSKPSDAKAAKALADLKVHLDKTALERRRQHAEKLDAQDLAKQLKGMGLPY